ncbi:MAG: radical SAM family heme chaperone HemW [Acholeplasmataceae bacterium]|nr:radical SAM family heme chaperone HemW [Acholeplasmataceae bacterium]
MKGLYVHIPFCEHICFYCDFAKRVPKDQHMIDEYLNHLISEINLYESHFDSIETIYIGGGTPSMLNTIQTEKLLKHLSLIKPSEYTIEVNPESYTKEKGMLYKKFGINRISLGVQTFNQKILNALNRKHTNQQVDETVSHLREIGIHNINLDLIYALPKQNIADLEFDLEYIHKLNPTHVSAYSLILEEKTVFYHEYLKGNFKIMDEDLEAQMYQKIIQCLTNDGYEHYEISNFCKPGYQSKHNLIYWSMGEYIGVGVGAHGLIDGYRTQNHRVLSDYNIQPQLEKTLQTLEMNLQDELIFGLRKIQGIDILELEHKYDFKLLNRYPKLIEKIDQGLVSYQDGILKLTEKGIFLGNQVFMVFI